MAFSVPVAYPSKGTRRHFSTGSRSYEELQDGNFKNSSAELFCSKCTKNRLIVEANGFCKVCEDFLCAKCVEKHESSLMTLYHGLITGSEMLSRYRHAMRKGKKTSESQKFQDRVSRNTNLRSSSNDFLDMVANDKANIYYTDETSAVKPEGAGVAKDAEIIKEPRIKVSTDPRNCFICACIVLPENKVVLADANNRNLKLYNKHFNCLSVFNMKREPWDMCESSNPNSEFYVTESHVKGIHHFRAGNEIKYILTIKVSGDCYGITSWKGGVAVSVKADGKYGIKLLDHFGNIQRNITDGFQGKLKLSAPWYLSSIKRGQQIVVSDAEASSLSCIDTNGGVIFVFKNRRELRDPRNIATDNKDNIYVVDYETDSVRQISGDGRDLGVILCSKDGLNSPCGLACHDGRLLLQRKMDSNTMQLYDLV